MSNNLSLGELEGNPETLRIVFTDPKSGGQLRIYAKKPFLVSKSFDYKPLDLKLNELCLEFFCENLQYSDKLP